jgi:hypothetical protein
LRKDIFLITGVVSFPHVFSGNPEALILKELIVGAGLKPPPTGI